MQLMSTKRVPCLHHLIFDESLSASKLKSLEHRRLYLDFVLLYKIVHGFVNINMYDIGISLVTERQSLRNYGFGLNVCSLCRVSVCFVLLTVD